MSNTLDPPTLPTPPELCRAARTDAPCRHCCFWRCKFAAWLWMLGFKAGDYTLSCRGSLRMGLSCTGRATSDSSTRGGRAHAPARFVKLRLPAVGMPERWEARRQSLARSTVPTAASAAALLSSPAALTFMRPGWYSCAHCLYFSNDGVGLTAKAVCAPNPFNAGAHRWAFGLRHSVAARRR